MKLSKSNVFSKGQGGANFEFRVQSAFVTYMLIKGSVPCMPDGEILFLRLQASSPPYKFHTDDLYIEFLSTENNKHKLLAQIKHNLTFSEKDKTFLEVIKAAWNDFNSDDFNPRFDKIMVVKGNLSTKEYNHLLPILDWAKFKLSSGDFFDEVNAIQAKQHYLNAFKASLTEANEGRELSPRQLWSFLKCFCVISCDFNSEGSKDLVQCLNLIKLSIPDNANYTSKIVWDRILEFVSKADSKGSSFSLETLPFDIKNCFKSKENINLFVHHKESLPLSFDYFLLDDQITKSFTEEKCKFKITIENQSSSLVVFDSISIKTHRYEVLQSKVVRLHSVKGRFVPEKFFFTPSNILDQEVEILSEDELFKIAPNEQEVIIFELQEKAVPGFYELIFLLNGHCGNRTIQLKSKILPVTIESKSDNRLTLETMKFFETPIEAILNLDETKWRKLKKENKRNKYLLYLGQTINELPKDIPSGSDWKIKGLKKQDIDKEGFSIDSKSRPKVFVNLGIPIEEQLFGLTVEEKSFLEIQKKTTSLYTDD